MRISTRLIAAASFAAMSLVAGAALADGDTIVFGTDATYPPFESLDAGGKFTGFDIDITNALCDHMKVKCTFVNQDFDGIIPALQAKKFDAIISSMSITPEREKIVDFTNKIYNTPPAIAIPKDSTLKEATDEALKGKKVAVPFVSTGHYSLLAALDLYFGPSAPKGLESNWVQTLPG